MNERTEKLLDYLAGLYVPKDKTEKMANLTKIILENDYRAIEPSDTGKMFTEALVIATKGNSPRDSFDYYIITRVDVGKITENYADIAVFDYATSSAITPLRIARTSLKYSLLIN